MTNAVGQRPTKHQLLELNKRVDDLARQSPTLAPAQAKELAKEFGVSLGEVQTRFDAQLRVIEEMRDRSQTLRDNNSSVGGKGFAGQAVASSTSPALKGANLKVPGDETRELMKQWQPLMEGLDYINDRIQQGRLSSPAADLEYQALAKLAPDPVALWSKEGAPVRAKLNELAEEFARLLPNAVVAVIPESGIERRAAESALSSRIQEAQFAGDTSKAKELAGKYLRDFPNAPMAAWAKNIVNGDA